MRWVVTVAETVALAVASVVSLAILGAIGGGFLILVGWGLLTDLGVFEDAEEAAERAELHREIRQAMVEAAEAERWEALEATLDAVPEEG